MELFWRFALLFSAIVCTKGSLSHLDAEVETSCIQRCPQQQCTTGCKLWKQAIQSSCIAVCNGTSERLPQKQLYCVMGCNDGVTTYFTQLKQHLGTPPAPALVADSLTATSLRLEWNFPEAKQIGLRYLVQWRYEQSSSGWQYCRCKWDSPETVLVDNLAPYTKYRFRVVLLLAHHGELIPSAPSVVISTLASGVPSSPPSIVRAVAIDSSRISVSWEPGQFLHGPLLSYVLRITDNHPNGYSALKDISPDRNFHMFPNLMPLQNYTISISMRNEVGSGPVAEVSVMTPPEKLVKDTEQPMLIVAAYHDVIKQGKDLVDEPVKLYSTKYTIRGIAIHVYKKLLFISDSQGSIHRLSLESNSNNVKTLLSASQLNFLPLDLSVDWLNNHLYVIGEIPVHRNVWQITRCNLDGLEQTVAIAGLKSKPLQIEVDPYNGFLFWTANDFNKIGIYRLDLSDISNGVKHEVKPTLILQDSNIGAFTVDYGRFRLLVSYQNENTVKSVPFDGTDANNLRPNINKSRLQRVISLAMANDKFFWTDGMDVFYEEYHEGSNSFFHNTYTPFTPSTRTQSYLKVLVNLPSAQPIPHPVNPPTEVQVIFGMNLARISWRAPHLLGFQGKGAWQNWSYQVEVKQRDNNATNIYKDINTTSHTISNLKPYTTYTIKAAGYTVNRGPWSSEFTGTSLRVPKDGKHPFILWSATEGLLKSDTIGENVETLIHGSMMKGFHFVNVAWFQDLLYLVSNTSEVYTYNTITHHHRHLRNIENVESIAIDWIGEKLYWSNPKQQLIIRGNLDGKQQEPLPILTLAKELAIDATKAYLYWSTGYAVECAHLNGADCFTYHPAQLFSGKQVTGLTLDMEHHFVYWIIRSTEGSEVFKAPMAGYQETEPLITKAVPKLYKPNIQGPLCYFDNRLLWLQDFKSAAISDTDVKNVAMISGKSMSKLTMVYVLDYSLHTMPNVSGSNGKLSVIPEAVKERTIRVVGTWKSFNVTWDRVTNVNYGTVFYEVTIKSPLSNESSILTTDPFVTYSKEVTPYTELQVSVKAYTYWGSSPQTVTKIFSPASTPSEPSNLRTFVTYDQRLSVTITVRWDPPLQTNGLLQGYLLNCWIDNETLSICSNESLDASSTEFVLRKALKNKIYSFKLMAYTEVGEGQPSDTITANTSHESPLPKLLIASNDSIYAYDMDNDNINTFVNGVTTPTEVGYLINEDKLFWVNKMNEILMFANESNKYSKIYDVNGDVGGLTVDWLQRSLYFCVKSNDTQESIVFKFDLNLMERDVKPKEIIRMSEIIYKIQVSPFAGKLYFTVESPSGYVTLKQSNMNGSEVKDLINQDDNCNCSYVASVHQIFMVDHSNAEMRPRILFLDQNTNNLLETNQDGCNCKIVATTSQIQRLQSDVNNIYWTNFEQKLSSSKGSREIRAQDFLIFGPHMQPFPDSGCLLPELRGKHLDLLESTADSLVISLPEAQLNENCTNKNFATLNYIVLFSEFNESRNYCTDDCALLTTFETEVTIGRLKPYTKYKFMVTVRNHHVDPEEYNLIGPEIFQTAAGVPSAPQNVSADVLSPTLAEVRWSKPEVLNGPSVRYEIHWQTLGSDSGIRQKGEQTIGSNEEDSFISHLQKLTPNETYSIWVRAYSVTNETFTDSKAVKITTYPEPEDVILEKQTAYSLKLRWRKSEFVQNFSFEYTSLLASDWLDSDEVTVTDNNIVLIIIQDLRPKTQYKIRIILNYPKCKEPYIWPLDSRFVFETEGDRPSPPGIPRVQHVKGDVYQVWWEPSRDNGAPIELYTLQVLRLQYYRNRRSTNRPAWLHNSPEIEEQENEWESVYNGSDSSWIITGLNEEHKYAFRALALNAYGWSDPSEESVEFDFGAALRLAEKPNPTNLILVAICVPVTFCLFLIVCFFCCKRQCQRDKKTKKVLQYPIVRGPDVELATLRELPRRSNFIQNTNILYQTELPSSDNLVMLTHIRRDQITLTTFLGSGAFGEVFEGKAYGIGNGEMKVAVKTLRKGATEQEKSDFLKEAELMSQFKHKHILQLLGVCLDNDPHFIIMELMEGGDLLTYLRSTRKTDPASLSLLDLLKMCVDVATGCCYLEENHFVHRDLACRNCLVSSPNASERMVKIGDFGLARDIYKNDYYRKEGEGGLLPIRWMAPESLVYGVFTSQSDVWSFGVLLWEIMTLGQQPYPAVSNIEVLCYLKDGKRLGKPTDCPGELHALMLKCWDAEPEARPTFKYCLEVLEGLHGEAVRNPVPVSGECQYISVVPDGSESKAEPETQQLLAIESSQIQSDSTNTPKYLELLYDKDCTVDNDGYEIPTFIPTKLTEQEITNSKTSSVVSLSTAAVGENRTSEKIK